MSDYDEKTKDASTNVSVVLHDNEELPHELHHDDMVIDPVKQKRLLRKLDFRILPVLAIMYLFNALDKGSAGNAKTDHMDKDIGLVGNQWYITVMIFYVPLCLAGTPIAMFCKRYSAANVLPIMMLGFGSCAALCAAVTNFGGFFALRFLLGIFESAMLPGVVFYLSQFYQRGELAGRIGIFYSMSMVAGAFSGLLAFGLFHVKSTRIHGWQLLFIVEGAGTLLFAGFAFWYLPRTPARAKFLSQEEKDMCRVRSLRDGSVVIDEKLVLRDAFMPFIEDWRYIVWALLALGLGVPLASVGNFLPQIIGRLGLSVVQTNLYTVAPNIVGAAFVIIFTQSSDYFRERSIHVAIPLFITMVGFVILGVIDVLHNKGVAYFACFLLCIGSTAPSVLLSTWYSNSQVGESKRAALAAVMVAIANSSGLISTNIFRAQDEPKYIPALATSAAIGGLTCVGALSWGFYMRWFNWQRNKEQGKPRSYGSKDVPTELLGQGPSDPAFRYFY